MKHYVIKWVNKNKNRQSVCITANNIIAALCKFEHDFEDANQITSIEVAGITINGIFYQLKQQ